MSEIQKNVITFQSSNELDTVVGYYYTCPSVKPRCILQISHGMCEYIERYADFAGFMARQGFVVCGNDHLGHGATSDGEHGENGFFAQKDGRKYVLQDLHRMNSLVCKEYPGLPLVLLGHSMGSFFARQYAATYPETLQGLILSGTGGPNPLGGFGIFLSAALGKIRGQKYRSAFVHNMAFGQYLKKIPAPATPYDWISRDVDVVARYAKDPKCTFQFTVSGFHEMICTLQSVSNLQWAQKLDASLPVALFSGDMDPVGDYGKGVRAVETLLQEAGVRDVSLKLYPGARHEILNETNRDEVYRDMLTWCETHVLVDK